MYFCGKIHPVMKNVSLHNNPFVLFWYRRTRKINHKSYLAYLYYQNRKHLPNFRNPKNLSEWIIARIVDGSMKKNAIYADKVRVRDYVKSKGLERTLTKIYGVWNKAEDIDFDKLPDKFVLKANHGCGYNIICRNKSELDISNTRSILNAWLKEVYNPVENHYKEIKPLLFAEEYIDSIGGEEPPIDYKFMCVKGKVFFILCCKDRQANLPSKLSLFDKNWNSHPEYLVEPSFDFAIEKPGNLEQMIEYAEILSRDFDFVRVDFYNKNNKDVIFGELTFTPAGGILSSFTEDALIIMNPNCG